MKGHGRTKVMAARSKLQTAMDILDNSDGVSIYYSEKIECLSCLVRATDDLRRIVTGDEEYEDYPESQVTAIWKDIGYGMEKTEYGLRIVLPAVMHLKADERSLQIKGSQAEKEYSRRNLNVFLKEEKQRLGINESFMRDVVLIFTHERTNKGLFDYDNLSTSPYINAINDCFLAADTAGNIDFLQRFERGKEDRTIVELVKKTQFAEWSRQNY